MLFISYRYHFMLITVYADTLLCFLTEWANKQADIYFLVDSSASVWILDYIKMLQFVASLVSEMDIGPSGTRVGVGVFSGDHKLYIPVDNNFTKDKLIGEIVKAPHLKGVTFLSRYACSSSFV